MKFRLIQRIYRTLLIIIVAMCTTMVVSQQLVQAATENEDKTASAEVAPVVDGPEAKIQEFIYQYLLGDIAWRRGYLQLASEALEKAAKISGDKETIFRAYGLGNVPLASHVAAIPSRPEHFRDGLALTIEVALVAGVAPIIHHVADACLMGVEAG